MPRRLSGPRVRFRRISRAQLELHGQRHFDFPPAPAPAPRPPRAPQSIQELKDRFGLLIRPESLEFHPEQVDFLVDFFRNPDVSYVVQSPTGSGKSYVEQMAASHDISNFRKVVLVAPSETVVDQHIGVSSVLELPPGAVAKATGSVSTRLRKENYRNFFKPLIVGTAESVRNDILAGRLRLKDVGLMIFDEVHHVVGEGHTPYKHAYAGLATLARESHVRTLGLSAAAAPDKASLHTLMAAIGARKFVRLDMPESEKVEQTIPVKLDEPTNRAAGLLEQGAKGVVGRMLDSPTLPESMREWLSDITGNGKFMMPTAGKLVGFGDSLRKLADTNFSKYGQDYSMWAALNEFRHLQSNATTLGKFSFLSYAHRKVLEAAAVESPGLQKKYLHQVYNDPDFKGAYRLLARGTPFEGKVDEKKVMDQMAALDYVDHPKEALLIRRLRKNLENGTLAGTMIFTDSAEHARFLAKRISARLSTGGASVRAVAACGQKSMPRKELAENLNLFSTEQAPVLVGTSLLEEGLHIPAARRAIMYCPAPQAIRVEQRRGRVGRKAVLPSGSGQEEIKAPAGKIYHLLGPHDVGRYNAGINRHANMQFATYGAAF